MNQRRRTLLLVALLVAVAGLAVASEAFSGSNQTPTDTGLPAIYTSQGPTAPVFIQYDQLGLPGGNFTYCGPACQANRTSNQNNTAQSAQSAASTERTCTPGMGPLQCYTYTHTNSNYCVALCPSTTTGTTTSTSQFCGPLPSTPGCTFVSSTTTTGSTTSWCGPLCHFTQTQTGTVTSTSWCGPLCQFTKTSTSTSHGGLTTTHNVTANAKVLILLAAFTDVPPTRNPMDLYNEWNTQIVNYYQAVSHGQYSPYADVYGWYTLPNNEAYYGANDNATGVINAGAPDQLYPYSFQIANDVLAAADHSGVNITKYTNVVVIHSGFGQESTHHSPDIWSVTYFYSPSQKPFNTESIIPEFEANQYSTVGVWCTEFGHQQGWPDMFLPHEDTVAKTGRWELESLGTWNGSPPGASPAYTLTINQVLRGWMSDGHGFQQIYLTNAVQQAGMQGYITVEVNAVESNSGNMSIEVITAQEQFYWIEVRTQTGWDSGLPGSGVIISKIIHSVGFDASSLYVLNATPSDLTLDHAAFQVGQTYSDPYIRVTVVSISGNTWTLHITVGH